MLQGLQKGIQAGCYTRFRCFKTSAFAKHEGNSLLRPCGPPRCKVWETSSDLPDAQAQGFGAWARVFRLQCLLRLSLQAHNFGRVRSHPLRLIAMLRPRHTGLCPQHPPAPQVLRPAPYQVTHGGTRLREVIADSPQTAKRPVPRNSFPGSSAQGMIITCRPVR